MALTRETTPCLGGNDFVTVTKATLTISAVTDTKVFDGGVSAVGAPTVTGLKTGDTVDGTLIDLFNSKNVLGTNGSTLAVSGYTGVTDGNGGGNYTVVFKTATGTITPEHITVTAVPNTKTYDGTTTASGTPIVTTGTFYGSDTGTFTETYGSPNAGTGLTLTPGGTYTDGNGGKNYVVTFDPITTGIINKALLTITPDAVSRAYDGTTLNNTTYSDDAGNYVITGLKNGETFGGGVLSLTGSMAFDGSTTTAVRNAATYSQGAGTLALGGTGAGNYTLSFTNPVPHNYVITPMAVTIAELTGTRVYDGMTDANASILTITDLAPGDQVTLSGTGVLGSKDVGKQQITNLGTLALGGADAGNYTLTGGNDYVTVTPFTVNLAGTRVYDGLTDGNASILGVTNAFAGDVVTVSSGSSTIASKNVGDEGITNFGTLTLGGADARDYTLVGATGTVKVTPLAITATGTRNI